MQVHFFRRFPQVFLLLFLFQQSIQAQTYSNKISSVGSFTAGLTSSNLVNDSVHFRPGILYTAGLTYSVMLGQKLNAEIELLYTGKAFKNDSPIIKYRYYFVDIPLMAQFRLGESVRLNAGIQYSIATNAQRIVIDPSKANGVDAQKYDPARSSDYGVLAGAEFDFAKSFSLCARYMISGSAFAQKNASSFGVFALTLKYSPIKTHKVFFGKKEAQQ